MKKALFAFLATILFAATAAAAVTTVTLNVAGMTCAICPITVRKALTRVPGVAKVDVHYAQKQVVVTFDDSKTNPQALTKATLDAGYPATVEPSPNKGAKK